MSEFHLVGSVDVYVIEISLALISEQGEQVWGLLLLAFEVPLATCVNLLNNALEKSFPIWSH